MGLNDLRGGWDEVERIAEDGCDRGDGALAGRWPGRWRSGGEQRLLVRDAGAGADLPGASSRVQLWRPGGGGGGPRGVDVLFMVSASESADRRAQHLTFVDAAAAAGVRQIVYTSFVNAAPDAIFTLVRRPLRHRAADHGQRDGVHVPAGQLLPRLHGARSPGRTGARRAGGRRTGRAWSPGPTSRRAATAVLLDPGGARRRDLHADRAGVADPHRGGGDRLTAARGRPSGSTTRRSTRRTRPGPAIGPGLAGRGLGDTYTAIAAGQLDVVTDHVERLTGRQADLARRAPRRLDRRR